MLFIFSVIYLARKFVLFGCRKCKPNVDKTHALRYADDLIAEINQLSYLSDAMAVIPSKTLAQYHPLAQRLQSNNRKWCIIFHKTDKFVFVHKIIPSTLIIW